MQPSVNKRGTETGRKPNMILLFLVENLRLWYTMST